MHFRQLTNCLVGLLVLLQNLESRDERGLSQSAENAILLAGAVGVAMGVIMAIKAYVLSHMPK